MKSPITGKEMSIQKEARTLEFRKESFPVMFHYYLCADSKEQFTSTELDEINMNQIYNQYRDKNNLPFPEEIKQIREMYDLPANKMSEVLGFGANSYRNYENGEVPSNSNGKLIQLAADPSKFKQLAEMAETLEAGIKQKLMQRIEKLIDERAHKLFNMELEHYLLDGKLPEMVVFFAAKMQPWKTQLNKLLFYSDFLFFKHTCFSMSGVRYRAIDMGPVPNNYNSIFEYMANNDDVDVWQTKFSFESIGEQFKPHHGRDFNASLFTEQELEVLNTVVNKFKGKKTNDIIEISHKEKAWQENEKDRKIISYKYAFELSQI